MISPERSTRPQVFTTTPFDDIARAGELFAELESIGYDGAFSYETKHNPFIPLTLAAASTRRLRLGTGIAIAFARTPMTLANVGWDLQHVSQGRFTLGLGSQVRPHITRRYSMPWSRPAARMREMVLAITAIWDAWDTGEALSFEGDFYTHTLMTPAFNPGPHQYGRAKIHVAAVGPGMTRVAAEVGDGLITHPFATRASLQALTLPAVEQGLAAAGRQRDDLEVVVVCLVATGDDGPSLDASIAAVRGQLGFYASTPAYAPVLEVHGWGDVHAKANAWSKAGRWGDLGDLITDEMVETIAVVGPREEIAGMVRAKTAGIADVVSIENTRHPDPRHFADIVARLSPGRPTI